MIHPNYAMDMKLDPTLKSCGVLIDKYVSISLLNFFLFCLIITSW